MRKAIITVGLGFGDEGKGATVDFLTRHFGAELVVRYCGGPQAGHNVELPDGRRHTFSQFGAGSLAGARTYLGPRMIINPATLTPEANHLRRLGIANPQSLLSVHPQCLLSSTYHVMMNRLRESARGAAKHGSCGLGVGETRQYWLQYGLDAVTVSDLLDPPTLINKLTLMRDRFVLDAQSLGKLEPIWMNALCKTYPQQEAELMLTAMDGVATSAMLPNANLTIFEGSQGVLLDEYYGFHPYTTWSTVTALHAMELIEQSDIDDVTTLGLTRAYTTRHGAGPFPTFCPTFSELLDDVGNPRNDWQDSMRCGPLDFVLLRYAAASITMSTSIALDGLVVNHLDELPPSPLICRRYRELDELVPGRCLAEQQQLTDLLHRVQPQIESVTQEAFIEELSRIAPVVQCGHGPTFRDRTAYTPDLA